MKKSKPDKKPIKDLSAMHPADIAEILRNKDQEERLATIGSLNYEQAALVLNELDPQSEYELLKELSISNMSKIIEMMPPDEAADILADLSSDKQKQVLTLMKKEDSQGLRQLMKYEKETAGGIMTTNFLALNEDLTASRAIEALRQFTKEVKTHIVYVYVIDRDEKFIGVLPIKSLVTASPNDKLAQLVNREAITVTSDLDQEEVARIVSKYNLLAVPVIDHNQRLLGIVTVDDVLDVIQEEDTEDIYKMAGIPHEHAGILEKSASKAAFFRLPWLIATLFGGIIAAALIKYFEATLEQVIALAFFIPVIADMGGNVGIQSSTITVRGLASGHIELAEIGKRLFRELRQALIMGCICGVAVGLVAAYIGKDPLLGLVLTIAMFSTIIVACLMGVATPLFFEKINQDPAVASGPFITTVADVTGILIYFLVATWLFGLFG
jgi:magnesium transporter